MKTKIITSGRLHDLESLMNSFIVSKNIISISYSHCPHPGGFDFSYSALILYKP